MTKPQPLIAWHEVVNSRSAAGLDVLLADDAVFHSPALHRPQEGKRLTTAYLTAALDVLGPTLAYRHEWWDASSAVLEFTAEVDGLTVNGVDMIRWDSAGRIVDFTVMVRPFKGLTALMEKMAARLAG
jgi:hypothetical protein